MGRKRRNKLKKGQFFLSIQKETWKNYIDTFFDTGFDINSKWNGDETVLSLAAEYGDRRIVQYLVERGADGNATNVDGTTPLHIAAKHNHQNIVEYFVNLGVCVDRRDYSERTPLHYAAEAFHVRAVQLHREREKQHDYRFYFRPMTVCSASENHMDLVHFLLANGADFDARDIKGDVPLLLATKYLCVHVVKILIAWGANVEVRDEKKWTVLHFASRGGWLDVAKLLVDRGVDVNAETSKRETSLKLAVEDSHEELVEFLIRSGASIVGRDNLDFSVLQCACERGWLNVVQSLVETGFDVNAKVSGGWTPVTFAIRYSHRPIFDLLVKSGANLNCCEIQSLLDACANGWLDVARSLVERGLDINSRNWEGCTPLFLAAERDHRKTFDMLLKSGARFYPCESRRWTFLHSACKNGWLDVVKLLVEAGSDMNAKTRDGETPLYVAAKYSHSDIFEWLLEAGADLNAQLSVCLGSYSSELGATAEEEWTVLHHVCYKGYLEALRCLIKKGIDVNSKTLWGDTLLHLAIRGGVHLEIIKDLLKAGADCNLETEEDTAFKFFIREYEMLSAEAIRPFLEHGAVIGHFSYESLIEHTFFKEEILKDPELCTQVLINRYNNDLIDIYETPLADRLPNIERMKITSNKNVAHSIEQSVRHDIETNGYCNVVEVRPMVLTLMAVESFFDHFL